MSWLSNAVKAVKKGVVDEGHFIGKAQNNPWVKGAEAAALAATGVGAPAAAALMAGAGALGGALRPGGGLKGAITEGGQGALIGGTAGLGGSALRKLAPAAISHFTSSAGSAPTAGGDSSGDPGSYGTDGDGGAYGGTNGYGDQGQSLGGQINDFATSHIPGLQTIEGIAKGGLGKMLGGAVGSVGGFLTGNGGLNALGIAQGINAASLQKKADDYAKQAVGTVQDSYNQRAPLRVAGIQNMLNPQTNDLSALTAHSGPYGQGLPKIAPARAFSAPSAA